MDPTIAQWRFKVGDQVVSADNQKIGKVVRVIPDTTKPTHLVVERGRLLHHDYFVPVEAVTNYEAGTVYLNVTKDGLESAGWTAAAAEQAKPMSEEQNL